MEITGDCATQEEELLKFVPCVGATVCRTKPLYCVWTEDTDTKWGLRAKYQRLKIYRPDRRR